MLAFIPFTMEVRKYFDTSLRLSWEFDFTAIVGTVAERGFAAVMRLQE